MEKLNLRIKGHDGIRLLSPLVQDAIVPRTLMDFDAKNNSFHMQMNRFCWEHAEDENDTYHRIHTHFMIHDVNKVEQKGFHHTSEGRHMNLLALDSEEKKNCHHVYFIFSDDRVIRICSEKEIHCRVWDFDEHWHTDVKPKHLYEYVN